MTTTKWDDMRTFLDPNVKLLNDGLDEGRTTIALLAGLSLARSWVTELEPQDQWEQFRQRLQNAVKLMTAAPDAGETTAFGLWDGLQAAAAAAGRIEEKRSGA